MWSVQNHILKIWIYSVAQIQEEWVELSVNEALKFQNGDHVTEFRLQSNIRHLCPGLWTIVKKNLVSPSKDSVL